MRNPRLVKWDIKDNNLIGLLVFAQAMEEMLFDYSLDTYKAPAMNSHTLCWEAQHLINQINNEKILPKSIEPVISELLMNINTDIVAKQLLGKRKDSLLTGIKTANGDLTKLKRWVDAIERYFGHKKYLFENMRQLTELVCNGKRKKEIIKLTRSLVTELINSGYTQSYIYFTLKRFFFDGSEPKIEKPEQIQDFFKLFNFKETEWTLVFLADKDFLKLKDIISKLGIEIFDEMEQQTTSPIEKIFIKSKRENQVFLVLRNKGLDVYNVRRKAEEKISMIAKLAGFFAHHKQPVWKRRCIVIDSEKRVFPVGPPTNAMSKRPNQTIDMLPKLVELTLVLSSLLKKNSFARLLKAVDLHGAALRSNMVENQLLNLWSAIEVMFPVPKDSNSRIQYIMGCLVPILQKTYTNKLLQNLYSDVLKCTDGDINLDGLPGKDNFERFVALLCIKKYKSLREDLYKKISINPLLINRIFNLHEKLSNSTGIKNLLDSHTTRVSWHIQRIYRSRNLLTHSGRKLPYIQVLVENLHNYVDLVINHLLYLILNEGNYSSFEDVILETKLDIELHGKVLAEDDGDCTDDNYLIKILV